MVILPVQWPVLRKMNGDAPLYGIPSHYSREVGMAAALAYANIRLDEVPIHGTNGIR